MAYYVTVMHLLGFQILKSREGGYFFRFGNGRVRRFRQKKPLVKKAT
ncbi:hypothetical protein [Caldalkalibacillus salinus]|nr:hypothetical protein [Caldalkalibacillus salinus]